MRTAKPPAIMGIALSLLVTTCVVAETTPEVFFRPAPDRSQDYDPDKVYPQGRIFPLGFYGLNLARDKPEGLTLIGPYGREFHYRVVTVPFEAGDERWEDEAARVAGTCQFPEKAERQ